MAFDEKDNAILLERVEPGGDRTALTDARRATREAAAILTDLHRPAPNDIDLPSLTDKVAGDLAYIRERLEHSAITKAEELVSGSPGIGLPEPLYPARRFQPPACASMGAEAR